MKNKPAHYVAIIIIMLIIPIFMSSTLFAQEERPVIVVGDDEYYPPYSFIDENGNPAGFNIELIEAVADAAGYETKIELDEWSKTREKLESEEIDIISGMVFSEEREEIYSFSLKHSVNIGDIFTRPGDEVSQLEDLRGKTIVVQRADIVAEYIASLDLDLRLIEVSSAREAIQAVSEGSYDYAALMKLPALYAIRELGFSNIESSDLSLVANDYGMAVLKGNEELLMELNSGLQIIKASGEYQEIYDKWINVYEEVTVSKLINKFWWIPALLVTILIILLISSLTLRYLVKKKTLELEEANQQLKINAEEIEANLEELTATEEELRINYEHLRISEEKRRSIIAALPDLVFTFSKDGRILEYHNKDDRELLVPKERFIGKYISEIMPGHISNQAVNALEKVFTSGELQSFSYDLKEHNEVRTYEIRIVKSDEYEAIAGLGVTSISLTTCLHQFFHPTDGYVSPYET